MNAPFAPTAQGQTENPPAATAYNDHQNMMDQLGVKKLRPGRNGQNQTGEGFDEATANMYKDSHARGAEDERRHTRHARRSVA